MFGFIKKKLIDKMTNIEVRELSDFNLNLSRLNSDEIGMILAQATNMRLNCQETMEVNLLEPSFVVTQDPYLPLTFNRTIKSFQKEGKFSDATAMMVWLHTLRSMDSLEVRPHGRELWTQLARGHPYVTEWATTFERDFGVAIKIDGFDKIPRGLDPEPT